jgi:hypothetical protein
MFFLAERLMASSYRLVGGIAPPRNVVSTQRKGSIHRGQANSSMPEILAHKITPEMPDDFSVTACDVEAEGQCSFTSVRAR